MLVDKVLRNSHLVSEIPANEEPHGRSVSSQNLKAVDPHQ